MPNATGRRVVDLGAPDDVRWIARKLGQAGYEAWAVGGAVRDVLAGLKPGDWDLTTSARPEEVRRIFRRTVPVGIEHGTVGVIARSGKMYEVTTFRRDVETFGRRARVVFANSLEEDLDRRDFTINAVAWNPITGELRDPHAGERDLAERRLRTVGDPARRFEEDRLRVLRALRFAGTFGLEVEDATWQAIRDSADRLDNLSAERIREELRKVLTGQRDPTRSLQLYADSGVLRALYPELDACRDVPAPGGETLWGLAVRTATFVSPSRFAIRLAGLLHLVGDAADADHPRSNVLRPAAGDDSAAADDVPADDGDSLAYPSPERDAALAARSAAIAQGVTRRLRCSNAETDLVTHLIACHKPLPYPSASDADLRRWIRLVGTDHLNDLIRLLIARARAYTEPPDRCARVLELHGRISRILATRPPLTIGDLAIGGAELRELGIRPGPLYGQILERLLDEVLEDPSLNSPDVLIDRARELAGLE